jgi:hypothetical protein
VEQVLALPRRARRAIELSDGQVLLACLATTLLLRLALVEVPLTIDEAGYAYVASQWGDAAGSLYGAQWVDRPPLLFALFALVEPFGDLGVRLLGCVAAVTVVLACSATARVIAGPRAGRWAAIAAAVLASSPLLQGHVVNAELPAIAFVSVSVALLVRAFVPGRAVLPLAVGSGLAAACAVLVKQSFLDGAAFAGAFGLVLLVTARGPELRRAIVAGGGFVAGAALALGAAAAWAELDGPGVRPLIEALYGFRVEALGVIRAYPNAPTHRAELLALLAVGSGLLLAYVGVMVALSSAALSRDADVRAGGDLDARSHRAALVGLATLGAFELLAVLLGGNWWRHYLLQLVPVLAIGLGAVAAGTERGGWHRRPRELARIGCSMAIFATFAACIGTLALGIDGLHDDSERSVGEWLRATAEPGDTLLVTWGHANLLRETGMRTPYSLSWSLPVRVRDPRLDELRSVLAGSDAPTWIVRWNAFSSWDLDPDHGVAALVRRRYERVGEACGHKVYRLRGAAPVDADTLAPMPTGTGCGPDIDFVARRTLLW